MRGATDFAKTTTGYITYKLVIGPDGRTHQRVDRPSGSSFCWNDHRFWFDHKWQGGDGKWYVTPGCVAHDMPEANEIDYSG